MDIAGLAERKLKEILNSGEQSIKVSLLKVVYAGIKEPWAKEAVQNMLVAMVPHILSHTHKKTEFGKLILEFVERVMDDDDPWYEEMDLLTVKALQTMISPVVNMLKGE